MKQILFGLMMIALFASCGKMGFRQLKSGVKYKIIEGQGKEPLKHGDMVKMFVESRYEDSLLFSSDSIGYQVFMYDSSFAKQTYSVGEVLPLLKIGDSVICKFKTDSILAKQYAGAPAEMIPAYIKKGKYFSFRLRLIKKYTDTAEYRKDQAEAGAKNEAFQQRLMAKMKAEQEKKDEVGYSKSNAELDKFLGAKTTSLKKTPGGVYVEVIKPGSGPACDSGKMVSILYRGSLLNGLEFDTNMPKPGDTTAKPLLDMVMRGGRTIPGFDEGIGQLREGDEAKIYLPAKMAYGSGGSGDKIPPFSNLMFDIKVVKVGNAPAIPQMNRPAPAPQQGGSKQPGHEGHNHE
jgi:FKBP-type peptidyl-prolyl cis-trans isomerase FkpA